jgi:hypothetical protein
VQRERGQVTPCTGNRVVTFALRSQVA